MAINNIVTIYSSRLEDGFTHMALNICLFSIKNDSSIIKNLNGQNK